MVTRALIVLLLVLNLGIAAWWIMRVEPAPAPTPAPPPGTPRLQLLGEVPEPVPPAATQQSPGQAPMASPTSPAAVRCYAFGPFADDAAATRAAAILAPQVLRSRVRSAAGTAARGWDVLLPPFPDRAAAQAAAGRLAAAGMADHYILAEGDDANAIALGRYRSEAAAQRRQAELQAAGFAATIRTLDAGATARWVDVATAPSFDAAAARMALRAAQGLPADCEALR
jgi:cell division protein FtsN